ncbi:MAG: WecB/TagA/CpsF family glycosyltransferase [Halieaceae bacterium]|jgi:N-acetylglucosaminyldiphosphoundecaprenol N-acetyl-beta-D-mannosaminyltransferase|nr:WecB/TagA/CpsF family glycosyltransferase [Halieaceae bacterium]
MANAPSSERECVNALGIPVDELTLESAVNRIAAMAGCRDGRARLVSTLNVDFLVNSLGTALARPRHPELFDVLRASDLVTADGFPIVWLSRILGRPLPGRVCGSDLVPALAERAAQQGFSIFLFGGAGDVAERAARTLQARWPALRIAGTAAPRVTTTGAALANTADEDRELLEQIHASGADLLLVGLGNPKQELWFNRNRERLQVPVSIGVGGSFEFITGGVRRAPRSWQRLNLEWVYRILQDPARLWRRYALGIGKLAALAAPVLWMRLGEATSPHRPTAVPASGLPWRRLWSARDSALSLLPLPRDLGQPYLRRALLDLRQDAGTDGLRILDFSRVRRIRLDAQQEFFSLARLVDAGELKLMGMNEGVRRQLRAARLIDLVDGDTHGALAGLSLKASRGNDFCCQSYSLGDSTLVMLCGRVNREQLQQMGFVECLLHSARDRRCIIDFRGVSLLESSGIAELLPLIAREARGNAEVLLSGVGYRVQQMLRMAEVELTAGVIDDRALLGHITGNSGR